MKIDYHEEETVFLRSPQPQQRTALDRWLRQRGFQAVDDFYNLKRKGRCEPWQTSTIVTLSIRRDGDDVYETEEDLAEGEATTWDELKADYLLATLPRDCIVPLVCEIEALATAFNLSIKYLGEPVDSGELLNRLNAIADQLSRDWDEPGSESLAILIEQQYG